MKRLTLAEVFAVHDSTSCDGWNGNFTRAYFTQRADAEKCAKHDCSIMGGGSVSKETLDVRVYESYAEYKAEQKNDLRKAALAKLSAEERQALGLAVDLP